jgi:antirestriction protein ArdC
VFAILTRATSLPTHSCTQLALIFSEGHGEAFYVSSLDFIWMPSFDSFKRADHRKAVGRWTPRLAAMDDGA